jgi:DNA polymerase-1
VLKRYAELSALKKTLSTDIPLLQSGTRIPIQARFESLLETGRTSSSPNIQNVSTDFGVRECFVPAPGKVFVAGDYSGFELRTWAQVCLIQFNESEMAKALNAGMDPHLKMASLILKISYEQAAEEFAAEPTGRVYKARQSGKVADFGYPGGLGYKRFVDYARTSYGVIITEEEARKLKAFWSESWPESLKFFAWAGEECEKATPVLKQFVSNRYRGDLGFTEFCNSTFQGLAADAAKNAGFLVSRACYADETSPLYGGRPVNFIHDEVVVEIADTPRAHDAALELARLMILGADPFLPDVPPKVEPLISRRWSKKAKPVHGPDGRLVPWDLK